MDSVVISGGIPKCPSCSKDRWIVKQLIARESDLKRVDGLGDLEVEPPDPVLYRQQLMLSCKSCKKLFKVFSYCESYSQESEKDSTIIQAIQDQLEAYYEGEKNILAWPDRTANNSELMD